MSAFGKTAYTATSSKTNLRPVRGGAKSKTNQDLLIEGITKTQGHVQGVVFLCRELKISNVIADAILNSWELLIRHLLPMKSAATVLGGMYDFDEETMKKMLLVPRTNENKQLAGLAELSGSRVSSFTLDAGDELGQLSCWMSIDGKPNVHDYPRQAINDFFMAVAVLTATLPLKSEGKVQTKIKRKVANARFMKDKVSYDVEARVTMFGLFVAIATNNWSATEAILRREQDAAVLAVAEQREELTKCVGEDLKNLSWTSLHYVVDKRAIGFFIGGMRNAIAAPAFNQGVPLGLLAGKMGADVEDMLSMYTWLHDNRSLLAEKPQYVDKIHPKLKPEEFEKLLADVPSEKKMLAIFLWCRPDSYGVADRQGKKVITHGPAVFSKWTTAATAEAKTALLASTGDAEAWQPIFNGLMDAQRRQPTGFVQDLRTRQLAGTPLSLEGPDMYLGPDFTIGKLACDRSGIVPGSSELELFQAASDPSKNSIAWPGVMDRVVFKPCLAEAAMPTTLTSWLCAIHFSNGREALVRSGVKDFATPESAEFIRVYDNAVHTILRTACPEELAGNISRTFVELMSKISAKTLLEVVNRISALHAIYAGSDIPSVLAYSAANGTSEPGAFAAGLPAPVTSGQAAASGAGAKGPAKGKTAGAKVA